ncbi:N-acetylglucosamine kinase [Arachidicoccus terrestris]|uniref:N-acetylglucosamine kinase n=1 Tax=Arachidicoccus terrestris TaxID=2875539 RepID=UPI001CC4D22C|nr:N-acetylglucosamine kinase [Arachidicoccus terrestris]UAY55942.1 N-acetylglucosamine kinase [Arachidicoccus terrestris]
MSVKLIADNGSTKCSWLVLENGQSRKIETDGLSPYFLSGAEISNTLSKKLIPKLNNTNIDEVHFYGTGLADSTFRKMMSKILKDLFPAAACSVNTDLMGAAHATCGDNKGIVSILGTGSGCAYYSGKTIKKVQNGLGFILGDEGSGAYLGRKVIQYYLYNTFDDDLMHRYKLKYETDRDAIIQAVYRGERPNRYLAGFSRFLSENRGHYMIENILEDCLNDFINQHIYKFTEAWTSPLHFVGSVAYAYRDVLKELCNNYELELGSIMKHPIDGLAKYHGQ